MILRIENYLKKNHYIQIIIYPTNNIINLIPSIIIL
jgi:hypothetical protein